MAKIFGKILDFLKEWYVDIILILLFIMIAGAPIFIVLMCIFDPNPWHM